MRYDHEFRESGYHSAFLTTFSFSAEVFENTIIPALNGTECRNLMVVADRDMSNTEFAEIGPPSLAGRRYHFIKRSVPGAFHPKLVVQLGEKKGRLMIGSANLTGGGLVGNLEAVATYRVSLGQSWSAPLFAASIEYLRSHIDPTDKAASRALSRALDFDRTPWLKDVAAERMVYDESGSRHAILNEADETGVAEQFINFIGSDPIHSLIILSPFWDEKLGAVSRLQALLNGPETSLIVDHLAQDFNAAAFAKLNRATLHSNENHPMLAGRSSHAKLIVACGEQADYVLTGSSNASNQGLFSRSGGPGNAEMGFVRTEVPGTALKRLGLLACLSEEMDPADLVSRDLLAGPAGGEGETLRDGGALSLEGSNVSWTPPYGIDPISQKVEIETMDGTLFDPVVPKKTGDRWAIPLHETVSEPILGRILFEDGKKSAPVPIANIKRLNANAEPPVSRAARAILDHIDELGEADERLFALAYQLTAMHQTKRTSSGRKKPPPNPGVTAEDEDMEELTAESFFSLDEDSVSDQDDRDRYGAFGEIRKLINSALKISMADLPIDDEAVEVFPIDAELEEGATGVDQEGGDIDLDDDQDDAEPEGGNNTTSDDNCRPQIEQKNTPKLKRKPDDIEEDLVKHVQKFLNLIGDLDEDPLSIKNAMLARLLVMAILHYAAPSGLEANNHHPILPDRAEGGGWVRLLGRVLKKYSEAWQRSVLLDRELDHERIEALSLMLLAGDVTLAAARAEKMSANVCKALEQVRAHMSKQLSKLTAGLHAHEAHMVHTVERYGVEYARLSGLSGETVS